ncbi:MAG: NADH-quinone oxidoreductase subunit NuoN [Burkholderiales bacterium]|jgi:NADH-quinone oxidoreductase subunit N|nr:NADH-quinone oxidoreductase subunit NuoN [Burkholderiales bacterium]MCA3156453.1 NADH-quinone oxidoreductase subunit NuoN [Burkholderiales bacterium]MCA3168735.1 NADH-quinone oxidoreductase subunit NuoN [Burkholderiales bacterium]
MTLASLNLTPAYPEIFLALAAMGILLLDLFISDARRYYTYWLTLLTLAITAALNLQLLASGETQYSFYGTFVGDPVAYLLKIFACGAVAVTLIYARQYAADRGMMKGELYTLAMFSLLGQMILISANSLLILYLGLELLALSMYALVALRRDDASATEAAMKYFVLGALASGFLLYGMSMIYGATGTLDLSEIAKVAANPTTNEKVLVFGIVFLVAGIAFKVGAVPFHMWVPDVYHGSPTAITLMIAGAPKLAAFAMILRLLAEGLLTQAGDWQLMLGIVAVLSIALGNITAIAQTNLKRMLAYSTIAQMGFMLLGFMSGVVSGNSLSAADAYSASMFYSIVYVFTTLGTFGVILLLARQGFECDTIDDLKGLNKRAPWLAFIMLLLMFSLAGIPPTVGFWAKLSVLQAVVNAGYIGLAIAVVIFSLIGAFYYLRVVKAMYFDAPTDAEQVTGRVDAKAVLALNGALVLVLGLFNDSLLNLCLNAVKLTLSS